MKNLPVDSNQVKSDKNHEPRDLNYVQKLIRIKCYNPDKENIEKESDLNHVQSLIGIKSNRSGHHENDRDQV